MAVERDRPEFPAQGCAVVFGGSGGLGGSIASLLGERGANVLLSYHSRAEHATALAKKIAASGVHAACIHCDVTDRSSVKAVFDRAMQDFGGVHSVISAGGLQFGVGMLADVTDRALRDVMETDVIGFFNIAQSAVPVLRAAGGSITALVTCAIARTIPTDVLSSAPKAAVALMIKHIASEEGQYGIRANVVGPGLIDAGIGVSMAEAAGPMMEHVRQITPLRRVGTGRELAEAVAFLASTRAAFVTGQVLMADGGLSI